MNYPPARCGGVDYQNSPGGPGHTGNYRNGQSGRGYPHAYDQGHCPGPISVRDLIRWGRKLAICGHRTDVKPIYHAFDKAFGNGVNSTSGRLCTSSCRRISTCRHHPFREVLHVCVHRLLQPELLRRVRKEDHGPQRRQILDCWNIRSKVILRGARLIPKAAQGKNVRDTGCGMSTPPEGKTSNCPKGSCRGRNRPQKSAANTAARWRTETTAPDLAVNVITNRSWSTTSNYDHTITTHPQRGDSSRQGSLLRAGNPTKGTDPMNVLIRL